MSKMPYSHKNEMVAWLNSNIKESNLTDKEDARMIADSISKSQTFRLPHMDSLPVVKDYLLFYEFMKSPYDKYLIEMPYKEGWFVISVSDFSKEILEQNLSKASKEMGNISRWWDRIKGGKAQKEIKNLEDRIEEIPSFICFLFFKKPTGWITYGGIEVFMDETGYEAKGVSTKLGQDELNRFAWTVFEFMVAVNTPNIKQSEVKSPKLINAKRKVKGKPLLEGYKYLDLMPREIIDSEATGSGSTKRMHWRRGHIRRLTNKTTWVKPSLIGKHGFIDKTYRLPTK